MKISLTKFVILAVYVPTLILMAISGFFLIQNYKIYSQVKKSAKYLTLAKKLEEMLVYLGQERGVSSIYVVSRGEYPHSKELLAEKREAFSKKANELINFVNKNPQYKPSVQKILDMLKKLPKIRKDIDEFKTDYIKTYFFTYYTVLESEIIKSQAYIFKYFPEQIKKTYELKFPFEKIIAYSGIIRGFGSYFITQDIPLTEKEYKNVILKYYHDTNILPISLLCSKYQKKLNSKEFKQIEENVKTVLFYFQQANMLYYKTHKFNSYPIDALDYFELFTKRINYFNDVIKHLNKQINNELNILISNVTSKLIQNIIIQIISLAMLLIGYLFIKQIKQKHID